MTTNKKFKVGDKVISVKDTPEVPEGFVGYILEDNLDHQVYGYAVKGKYVSNDVVEYFKEDEIELLNVSQVTEKKESTSALDKQVSGNHYKDCGIQPIEYIHANGLSYLEGNVIKYTTRHSKKNGRGDIEKAIHYLELILEMEYKGETI